MKRENPMAVTTEAATTGVMIFLQYFARSPSIPSKIPPTISRADNCRISVVGGYGTENCYKGKAHAHNNRGSFEPIRQMG